MFDATQIRPPIWPLLVAPIVAVVYYSAIKFAFVLSLDYVVSEVNTNTFQSNWEDIYLESHWVYRGFAEFCSIAIATYVSSGLARERSYTAGVIAGSSISICYATPLILTYITYPDILLNILLKYPWNQIAIECLLIVGSPYIGIKASEIAKEVVRTNPVGFDGINRFHFTWLWIAMLGYAVGLIGPGVRFYARQFEFGPAGIFGTMAVLLNTAPPLIPAHFGLRLLSGRSGASFSPLARNGLGAIVLFVGFFVGTAWQYGFYLATHWVFGR